MAQPPPQKKNWPVCLCTLLYPIGIIYSFNMSKPFNPPFSITKPTPIPLILGIFLPFFLDQQQSSYHHTTCSCCSSSCWAGLFKKGPRLRHFKSDWD